MVSVGLVSRLRAQLGTRTERLLSAARLAGLAALLWATAHQPPPNGVVADHPVKWVLMVGAGIGWIGWMASRRLRAPGRTTWCFLALLAASGGALSAYAPIAITFMAVAGLGAGIAFEGLPALAVGAIGVGGLVVATVAVGAPAVLVAEGAVSVVVGLMVGASRRQYVERTFQAEELLAERVRADAERDRAAALAERNRIGREVHDVLAHSLGALSVQLDAADALLENGADDARARQLVQGARRLAVQGLEETRQAVHALPRRAGGSRRATVIAGGPRRCRTDRDRCTPSAHGRCRTGALSRRSGGGHQCPEARARGTGVDSASAFDPQLDDPEGHERSLPRHRQRRRVADDRRRIRPARHARADRTVGWPGRGRAERAWLDRPGGGAGVRVVVVDDQTVVREGLVTLLETMPGIEVVGSASDGEEAVDRGRGSVPGGRLDGPAHAPGGRGRGDEAHPC